MDFNSNAIHTPLWTYYTVTLCRIVYVYSTCIRNIQLTHQNAASLQILSHFRISHHQICAGFHWLHTGHLKASDQRVTLAITAKQTIAKLHHCHAYEYHASCKKTSINTTVIHFSSHTTRLTSIWQPASS